MSIIILILLAAIMYGLFGSGNDPEFIQASDLLYVLGIIACVLILQPVAALIFQTPEERKRRYRDMIRALSLPEFRMSIPGRDKAVRVMAAVLAILIVAGWGYRGWLNQTPEKLPAEIARTEATGKPDTPQTPGVDAGNQKLEGKPVQTDKLPEDASGNKLAVPPVDLEAIHLNLKAEIQSWASAWSAKKVNDYLGHYSKNFVPSAGMARGVWEASRRERINKAKGISIAIEEIKFLRVEPTQAEVVFRQRYKSDGFADDSQKTLILVYADGLWKIDREDSQQH